MGRPVGLLCSPNAHTRPIVLFRQAVLVQARSWRPIGPSRQESKVKPAPAACGRAPRRAPPESGSRRNVRAQWRYGDLKFGIAPRRLAETRDGNGREAAEFPSNTRVEEG